MMKLVRHGLDINYYSSDVAEINRLENGLKFFMEGAQHSTKYRTGHWDGYIRFYDRRLRTFNYGLLHMAIAVLNEAEIEYRVEKDFAPLQIKPGLKITEKMEGDWRHQREGIGMFLQSPYGTIQIPTRGGKTKMTAEIMRVVGFEAVLFVVDGQLLFEQAIKDISEHLGISKKQIGRIQGETFELKPITVAMIQTMQTIKYGVDRLNERNKKSPRTLDELREQRKQYRFRAKTLKQYMETVQFLVLDEVHVYCSDERINTARDCCNARAVLCLSATPEKSSKEMDNIRIKSVGGPIIYVVPAKTLKERGVLAQEKIALILVDHTKDRNIILTEEDTYDTYEERIIINNERRNNILLNIIHILKNLNIKALVLFQYIAHGKAVQRICGDTLVTNETKLQLRLDIVKRFLRAKGGTLLATNIFNKGLTLPEVQVLFNAGGGKEQSQVVQKKGRTLGTTATKKRAVTIDFVDVSEYFADHSLSRVQVYEREVGKENILIYDSADSEFYNDLREFLVNWLDK